MFFKEKDRYRHTMARISRLRRRGRSDDAERVVFSEHFLAAGNLFRDPEERLQHIWHEFRVLKKEARGLFLDEHSRSVFFKIMDQLLAESHALHLRQAEAARVRLFAFAGVFMEGAPEVDDAIRLCRVTKRFPAQYAFELARAISEGRKEETQPYRPPTGRLTADEVDAFIGRICEDGEPGALRLARELTIELACMSPKTIALQRA
jgi:hypothetical protein